MEPRGCIACGSEGPFDGLYERHGYTLVRCRCGLVFQRPQPTAETLERAYYGDQEFARALLGELRELTLENARHKLRLLRRTGALRAGMSVLDVGASSGAWLEVVAEAGIEGVGVELGEATAAGARERGLDVRTGTLADALPGLGGRRFDLVSFWDVLEHLRDPRRELELARRVLTSDGAVAATFPNVDGLYPRLTRRLITRRTGVWEHPELPVHLYDFSPSTARAVFERQGYAVERVETFAIPFEHYRATSLVPQRLGGGARGRALRAAFEVLRVVAYPISRVVDRGNAMFVLARPVDGED